MKKKSHTFKESLVLFDGNNILNRGFHAVPPLKGPDGTPTNAIKGALNIFLKVIRESAPTHVGCVFDHPSKNFRHEIYPEYKGNRDRDPVKESLLNPQKPLMRQMLKSLGLRVLHKRGLEADDVIGALAKLGLPTTIVSNDKDFAQLLDRLIVMLRVTGSGEHRVSNLVTQKNCEELMGVTSNKIIEFLMLMGDKVDNIPGVTGVAEKTAAKLLNTHGSIKGIMLVDDTLTPKLRENFAIARKQFKLTRELVTIRPDIIDYDVNRLLLQEPDVDEFKALCKQLGMKDMYQHTMATMNTHYKLLKIFGD